LYDLAVSDKYEGDSGKYYDNDSGGFGKAHADAYDESVIGQLISVTDSILGIN